MHGTHCHGERINSHIQNQAKHLTKCSLEDTRMTNMHVKKCLTPLIIREV